MSFHRLATYGLSSNTDSMPIEKDNWILMCNGDIYNSDDLWRQVLSHVNSNYKRET